MQIEIDSLGDREIWNMFKDYYEDFPEEFNKAMKGIKIKFNINDYFNPRGEKISFIKRGNIVLIRDGFGNKNKYTSEEFDLEIIKRISLMKRILKEIYAKEPLAKARMGKEKNNE